MKKYPRKIEYYNSYDTDFAGRSLPEKELPRTYRYVRHGFFHSVYHFLAYRCFATPLAAIYKTFIGKEKIIGREKLCRDSEIGYFIYANHTAGAADAFIPNLCVFPRRGYTVVNPKNFSMPVLGRSLYYFGALPVPTNVSSARSFRYAIDERIAEGGAVIIYPEAHLWLYDVHIRPFDDVSFTYPERTGAPSFSMTRVYRRRGKGYRTEVYIDGPFYPDRSLSPREARAKLAESIRTAMEERARLSDVEIIKYERVNSSE